jgi:hypothetical protein
MTTTTIALCNSVEALRVYDYLIERGYLRGYWGTQHDIQGYIRQLRVAIEGWGYGGDPLRITLDPVNLPLRFELGSGLTPPYHLLPSIPMEATEFLREHASSYNDT